MPTMLALASSWGGITTTQVKAKTQTTMVRICGHIVTILQCFGQQICAILSFESLSFALTTFVPLVSMGSNDKIGCKDWSIGHSASLDLLSVVVLDVTALAKASNENQRHNSTMH